MPIDPLKGTTMRFARCWTAILALLIAGNLSAAEAIDLTPAGRAKSAMHVRIETHLGGELKTNATGEATHTMPIQAETTLDYDELALDSPSGTPQRFVRTYEQADATINGHASQLRTECRRIVVQVDEAGRLRLAATDGPLQREEFDLLRATADSLTIDGLLPTDPVAEGDTWDIPAVALIPLMGLDTATIAEVTAVLTGSTEQYARFQFAGAVHGQIDGADVEMDVRGIALFDRQTSRLTKVNLAFNEIRKPGPATPGVDVTAKVNVTIEPSVIAPHYSAGLLRRLAGAPLTTALELSHPRGDWRTECGRQWHLVATDNMATTVRCLDSGITIGETTLSLLPSQSADRQPTFEAFEQEVRYTLSKQLKQVVASDQWTNAAGLRCMMIVSRGIVGEMPVEWRHYLAIPTVKGQAVSIATTVDATLADQLGGADRALVEALTLPKASETAAIQIPLRR